MPRLVVLLLAALSHLVAAQQRGATIEIAPPRGPFPVGTVIYHWTDSTREEAATPEPDRRELMVQLWYPARPTGAESLAAYVPRLDAYAAVWDSARIAAVRRVVTHSRVEAAVAPRPRRLPLVLLVHGWQSTRSVYTGLAEDLASRGLIVAGLDLPYLGRVALPGRPATEATEDQFGSPEEVVASYGRDVGFVLDRLLALDTRDPAGRLTSRVDHRRIAAIGHSSGFVGVAELCRGRTEPAACVNVDAPRVPAERLMGIAQPLLWVRLERAGPPPDGFLGALRAPVYEVTVPSSHGSVTDLDLVMAVSPGEAAWATERLRAVSDVVLGFLRRSLRLSDAPDAWPPPGTAAVGIHRPRRGS